MKTRPPNEVIPQTSNMIAALGEALVDLIEQPDGRFQACLGGSVCNFSVGLARQGSRVVYLNPLSIDAFGQRFKESLLTNNIARGASYESRLPTSLAVVSTDAHGIPSYVFHRQGVADRDITAATLIDCLPSPLQLMHTGGLALAPEDADKVLAVLQAAVERGALVSIDANLRPMAVSDHDKYLALVRQVLRRAHVVKVSDEDLAHLGLNATTTQQAAAILFADSATQLIALTRGASGASLLTRRCMVELAAPNGLQMADTVGAGDCFHAGLIAWLQRGDLLTIAGLSTLEPGQLQAALSHAMSAASVNIQRAGCDPATWKETEDFNANWCKNHHYKSATERKKTTTETSPWKTTT